MNNKDLHFRGQLHDEKIIAFFRDHWIVLLPKIVSFVLFLAIITLFFFQINTFQLPSFTEPFFEALVLLTILASGYMVHRFFVLLIEYFLSVTVITNYRIIHIYRSLYIYNDKESIYMRRIQDIQKQQEGLFKNIFRFGELVINVFGPDLITLTTVPNPDYHFRLLNRVRNELFEEDQGRAVRQHQPLHESETGLEKPIEKNAKEEQIWAEG